MKKTVLTSFTILCLLSTMLLTSLAPNIQPVEASGTIYIRADGSIDPPTANITTVDNFTYTFTDNILDSIVVERDNIVVDGVGYALQGRTSLSGRSNVTIKDITIEAAYSAIFVEDSYNIRISGNNITNNESTGINIWHSSNCSIFGNNIRNNKKRGIWFFGASSNNKIYGNNITNSTKGVFFDLSCKNYKIYENNITSNHYGISLEGILSVGYKECPENNRIYGNNIVNNTDAGVLLDGSLDNVFYHNNFINNTLQIKVTQKERKQTNIWDNGYASGGNYWSNYTGVDSDHDGIGDTTHVIDESNQDNHPLMGMFSDFKAISEHYVQTICNSTISDFDFNGTAISFSVTGEDGTGGFCRTCIPTTLVSGTYRVFVDGTEIAHTLLPCSNSTHSYLYFTYTHSAQEVVIIPEFPSTLIVPLLMALTLGVAVHLKKRRLYMKKDSQLTNG